MTLLRIGDNNDVLLYFGIGLAASVVCYFLLRRAVQSNKIVKNQAAIIYLMKHQIVKQGATEEELKKVDEDIEKILVN